MEEDGAISLETDENFNIQPTHSLLIDNNKPSEVEEFGNADGRRSSCEGGEPVMPITTSESNMLPIEEQVKANESIVLMNGNADIPIGT